MGNNNVNKKNSRKIPVCIVLIVMFLITTTISLRANNGSIRSRSSIPTKIENCMHDVLEFLDELVYDIFN